MLSYLAVSCALDCDWAHADKWYEEGTDLKLVQSSQRLFT